MTQSSDLFCDRCGAARTADDVQCAACGYPFFPDNMLKGRYHLLEVVGRGGMGLVYKAEDVGLGRRHVAIKTIRLSEQSSSWTLDQASKAFEREALLLARLSHPFLPSIHDHFEEQGTWYLVMEFIEGETLSARLKQSSDGTLPVDEALALGIKLCTVLSYLHRHNPPIIFSDLKPGNIMLTPQDDLYLIDFGIARVVQPFQEDEQTFVSRGYSAPEQFERSPLSPRADIYSLGATLHHVLSGSHPAKNDFFPLALGTQTWAPALNQIIMSMVARREADRPSDIEMVKQELLRIMALKAQEVPDVPVSPWGQQFPYPAENTFAVQATASETFRTSNAPLMSDAAEIYQRIHNPHFQVNNAAWSPDGKSIAVVEGFSNIQIWSWSSQYRNLLSEYDSPVVLHRWSLRDQASQLQIFSQNNNDATFLDYRTNLAWSPDGIYLAATLGYDIIFVWDTTTGTFLHAYQGHGDAVGDISWSPDGAFIASCGFDRSVQVWEAKTGRTIYRHQIHADVVSALVWSPNGTSIASASQDGTVQVWEAMTGKEICRYTYDNGSTPYSVTWFPDGSTLVSCGTDKMIHVWDAHTAQHKYTLEGHVESIHNVVFFNDGRLLLSASYAGWGANQGSIRVWQTATWTPIAIIETQFEHQQQPGQWGSSSFIAKYVDIHPTEPFIAAIGDGGLLIWELDIARLMDQPALATSVQYTNAKVVLVGDSGVGKSGLGLVLSQQGFVPTESTHGRVVWTFAKQEVRLPDERREVRETLLWDLAGQPGYRLVHQLHLNEVAVALVVFNAQSETDPFAGIAHWVRALQVAQRIKPKAHPLKKLLVLARMDVSGKRVSRTRIDELVQKQGFDGYFETSAKENINIADLRLAIRDAIDWDVLPRRTSTVLFQLIKAFILSEKQAGRLLSTLSDLERAFLEAQREWRGEPSFSQQFAAGVDLVDSAGFINHLSFGGLVLLQAELLDTYASALVNAARDEPDSLGHIPEKEVYAGAFPIPQSERIGDPDQERLLLIAMVEDLLSHEIMLREQGDEGSYLVFPSETTRENPALPDPENVSVIFTFAGPVLNIYATLAVRLSHSSLFTKKELWKNAITFLASVGGTCGLMLTLLEDGLGSLTLFFDTDASEQTRLHFEDYVHVHLQRKALPESIQRRRTFTCETCGLLASDHLIRIRRARHLNWYDCSGCGTRVWLLDREERLGKASASRIVEMDRAADEQRVRAIAQSTVQGKQEVHDFDTFLCYHHHDRASVLALGQQLKDEGLLPWVDEWELRPGLPWQQALEQQIEHIPSAVVCVGKEGIGPWQEQELAAFLRAFVNRRCPVIPVLLRDAPTEPALPVFLNAFTWVDFRRAEPDPLQQLKWGITGKRPF